MRTRTTALLGLLLCGFVLLQPPQLLAQRKVSFPPADSKHPPGVKSPPRTQASGEDTSLLPFWGPTMRKTQERKPPPPTTLTVMYKVQYGEKLEYVHPDGRVQVFDQWQSFESDGYQLINKYTNERLADGHNYQYAVKPLASPGFDPVDIPILYMTGDYDFVFSESEVKNLRKFLLDGGTILFNASRGREEFSTAVVQQMHRVFPQKVFIRMPPDHPTFNSRYRLKQVLVMVNGVQFMQDAEIYSMDIGTRAAAILIPGGMGAAWSGSHYEPAGRHIIGESAIRLGVNVIAYILGSTEYGRFLAQQFPVYHGASRPGDVFRYATLSYTGSWDQNPGIQNNLLQGLRDNTAVDVDYAPHVLSLDDTELGRYPVVFMTGHYDFEWTEAEVEGLRNYLTKGGTLVASSAAGLKPFDIAFRRELRKVFAGGELVKLPPTHAMFASGWNHLIDVAYTATALRDDPTLRYPEFYGLFVDKRLAVIYTPYDFQSGLNRESNAYAKGITSDDALRLALNIVGYVMSH